MLGHGEKPLLAMHAPSIHNHCKGREVTRMARRFAIAGLALFALMAPPAQAAEITAFISGAARNALDGIVPLFEQASGHKVAMQSDIQQVLFRRIDAGEPFDVVAISIDVASLIKQGKVAADSRTVFGRTGVGVAVRQGAPRPDFSTVNAFKRMLMEAKSVTHSEGSSGKHFLNLLDRLGMTDAIKPKIVQPTGSGGASRLVASGRAELAVIGLPPVLAVPGLDWLGWLPDELNDWIVFTGGASSTAREPEAARAFLRFLTTPEAAAVFRAKGLEPLPQ
jgi:molybdate transport system substrate-binding protein